MLRLEWKDIVGYEGFYMVSTYGQVKSLSRKVMKNNEVEQTIKEKILKPILKDGYLRVVLYKDDGLKRFYLHVLVANHFISNPKDKPEVNHIDLNRENCRVDNLEYNTRSENVTHMWKHGTRRETGRLNRENKQLL